VSDARRLVDKLWSFCNVLWDDGVSTIEYTEQLTYLLFLKMAHERATRSLWSAVLPVELPSPVTPPSAGHGLLTDHTV
jgi:type I restriction enzyme M protein